MRVCMCVYLQSEWFVLGLTSWGRTLVLELKEYYITKSVLVVVDTFIIVHEVYNNIPAYTKIVLEIGEKSTIII